MWSIVTQYCTIVHVIISILDRFWTWCQWCTYACTIHEFNLHKGGKEGKTLLATRQLWKSHYQEMSHNDPYSSNLHRNESRFECTNESASVVWHQYERWFERNWVLSITNSLFTCNMHKTHPKLPSYPSNLHEICPNLYRCCDCEPVKGNHLAHLDLHQRLLKIKTFLLVSRLHSN